jgi:drug/metabolite transporter (DMT)-like permease
MSVALLTAFFFGLTGVCATQAARLLGGSRANFWRLVVALAMLGLWAHTFGSGFGGGASFWFMLAGGVGFGLGGWCMFQALPRIGSTLSLLVVECFAAIFATAIGWWWLGAALTSQQLVYGAMILVGVVIGASPGPLPNLNRLVVVVGCSYALVAALFQAVSFNLSRHAFSVLQMTGGAIDPLSAAYQRLVGGALVAAALYGLAGQLLKRKANASATQQPASPRTSPLPAPAWVVLNALFGPVLGVSCMLWAISLTPNPGLVAAIVATATLITIPFARSLEGARPGIAYYAGCCVALAGIAGLVM